MFLREEFLNPESKETTRNPVHTRDISDSIETLSIGKDNTNKPTNESKSGGSGGSGGISHPNAITDSDDVVDLTSTIESTTESIQGRNKVLEQQKELLKRREQERLNNSNTIRSNITSSTSRHYASSSRTGDIEAEDISNSSYSRGPTIPRDKVPNIPSGSARRYDDGDDGRIYRRPAPRDRDDYDDNRTRDNRYNMNRMSSSRDRSGERDGRDMRDTRDRGGPRSDPRGDPRDRDSRYRGPPPNRPAGVPIRAYDENEEYERRGPPLRGGPPSDYRGNRRPIDEDERDYRLSSNPGRDYRRHDTRDYDGDRSHRERERTDKERNEKDRECDRERKREYDGRPPREYERDMERKERRDDHDISSEEELADIEASYSNRQDTGFVGIEHNRSNSNLHDKSTLNTASGDSGTGAADLNETKYKFDLTDVRSFIMKPIPKAANVVHCYIERNKSGSNKLFPEYCLYMKDGDRFLLTGKKRTYNKTSNYLISMQRGDLSRTSNNYIGKLRANFLGTEFIIYDQGLNPKDCDTDTLNINQSKIRQELGIVLYASNVLGSRGPRKMKVCVPRVRDDNSRVIWRPTNKDDEMLIKCKEQDHTNLTYLINKPPRWNESVCAYVLNFNGRVTMASVKNFQLVTPEDQETVVLQFGRVGKDLFTMDYRFPLCAFQAFAIALSSFDSKLACE